MWGYMDIVHRDRGYRDVGIHCMLGALIQLLILNTILSCITIVLVLMQCLILTQVFDWYDMSLMCTTVVWMFTTIVSYFA